MKLNQKYFVHHDYMHDVVLVHENLALSDNGKAVKVHNGNIAFWREVAHVDPTAEILGYGEPLVASNVPDGLYQYPQPAHNSTIFHTRILGETCGGKVLRISVCQANGDWVESWRLKSEFLKRYVLLDTVAGLALPEVSVSASEQWRLQKGEVA